MSGPIEGGAVESPVAFDAGTLVIGDLHLDPLGGTGVEAFVAWLDRLREVPRLVVLGDLFDLWIGPDPTRLAGAVPVLDGLKRLTWRGVALDVIPGNRDFLLDGSFEAWTGARLRPAGLRATSATGEAVLVLHGDELCTLDRPYQRMKRVLRTPAARRAFGGLPFALKHALATRLRGASRRVVPRKPAAVKAMQESACRAVAERHGARTVICGHAHRWRDERLDGGPRWIVIDGWGGDRDALQIDAAGEWTGRASADLV